MREYKFGILKNESSDSHLSWENACLKYGYKYDIIELKSNSWLDKIKNENYDCFLLRPPGRLAHFKEMYDERVYIISKVLKKFTYPSFDEIILHENKKRTSYWLTANRQPHIPTKIFYSLNDASKFLNVTIYPLVAKTSLGASGHGVKFIYNKRSGRNYIKKAFSKGIRRSVGPSLRQGEIRNRFLNWIKNPNEAHNKIKGYIKDYGENQKSFVLFQKYIKHDFEWRVCRIGNSYFAHKKIKVGEMCSGSKGIEYVNPPLRILDFVRVLCESSNFNTMAVDILEDEKGNFLINELQTIFGHVQEHILEVDGRPGRYLYINNDWTFEEGNFNTNLSFDLRLENVVELLDKM